MGNWFLNSNIGEGGKYIEPTNKNGSRYANLLKKVKKEGKKRVDLFNYHIEFEKKEECASKQYGFESKVLKMLLSRMLQ